MSPRARLGATAAVLFLFVACLASRRTSEGCSCRPAPPAGAPLIPAAAPAPALLVATPAVERPTPRPELPDFTDPTWTRVPSRSSQYLVCWRSPSGSVPRNEDFKLEV